jgi:hypothetical protein
MDHRPGQIDLIRWQGKRLRKARTGINPWTVILVVCGLIGGLGLAGQIMGWLPLTPPASAIPAALLLAAIAIQAISIVKAGLVWLAG